MCSPPSRGWTRLQAALLSEIIGFERTSLTPTKTAVKYAEGKIEWESTDYSTQQVDAEDEDKQRLEIAAAKVAALRSKQSGKDKLPCRVAHGLYIGSASAARNLKALRRRGITHVLNASPVIPCYFKDDITPPSDGGPGFTYLTIPIFDDSSANLLECIPEATAFIAEGRAAGGVLVHCYAGQSRSVALVMAYLLTISDQPDVTTVWKKVRHARPCALPNPGFFKQLDAYQEQLILEKLERDSPRSTASDGGDGGQQNSNDNNCCWDSYSTASEEEAVVVAMAGGGADAGLITPPNVADVVLDNDRDTSSSPSAGRNTDDDGVDNASLLSSSNRCCDYNGDQRGNLEGAFARAMYIRAPGSYAVA